MEFKNILNKWYQLHRRNLPWRDLTDPYHIWVSEVILQQTRVAQGISYYLNFIKAFPTVELLANANEDEVLKIWQGLGYYTRARNLHKGAKFIMEKHNGRLPQTYSELLSINGIGSYSAGAIASFAFKEAVPAIDGNVYRVMARIFGVFASPYNAKGKREFNSIVIELIDRDAPHHFNQALLDFGALQCIPRNPKCSECPFMEYCYAFRNNLIDSLPVKAKRIIPKDRFFVYILIKCKEVTFIQKRRSKDIWHSLYEFPLIETYELLDDDKLTAHPFWKRIFGKGKYLISYISPVVKHQLSHQTLYARFVVVEIQAATKALRENYLAVSSSGIFSYTVPTLIDNFLAAEPAEKYFLNTRGSN